MKVFRPDTVSKRGTCVHGGCGLRASGLQSNEGNITLVCFGKAQAALEHLAENDHDREIDVWCCGRSVALLCGITIIVF